MPESDALSARAATVLAQFPGPVKLPPSKLKWISLFAGSVAMTALGAIGLVVSKSAEDAMIPIYGGGLVVLGGFLTLLIGITFARRSMDMTLDATGFEFGTYWGRSSGKWDQVDGFIAVTMLSVRGMPLRTVAYHDASRPPTTSRMLSGRNASVFDTYRFSHKDLARLMTAWRARALAHRAKQQPAPYGSSSLSQ